MSRKLSRARWIALTAALAFVSGCPSQASLMAPNSSASATIGGITYAASPYSDFFATFQGDYYSYVENVEGDTSVNCWGLWHQAGPTGPGTFTIDGTTYDVFYRDSSGADFTIVSGTLTISTFPSSGNYLEATFSGTGNWSYDPTTLSCTNGRLHIYKP